MSIWADFFTYRTLSARSSDLRRQLKSPISRDGDVQIWRKWHRSKAESQGFRSVPFSSNLNITSSRYGRFECDLGNCDCRCQNENVHFYIHQEIGFVAFYIHFRLRFHPNHKILAKCGHQRFCYSKKTTLFCYSKNKSAIADFKNRKSAIAYLWPKQMETVAKTLNWWSRKRVWT